MVTVTTSEIVCSQCGARNRLGTYDIRKTPICGRCAAVLQEEQSVVSKRAIWHSWKHWTGLVFIVGVAAAGTFGLGMYKQSEPQASCVVAPPATGRYARYDRSPFVVPLMIRTAPGANYFIKVEDALTKRSIVTLFAVGGEVIVQKMPVGRFRLKYAVGERWCGDQLLFGSSTMLNEAQKIFEFDEDHTYTVELIRQQNGNLPVRPIDLKNF